MYSELREKFPKEKLYVPFGGGRPDKVIFMTGVNDEIQHVGANNYVEYTKRLVDYFADVEDEEVISMPRVDELFFLSPNFYSHVKRSIFRCLYDGCDLEVNDKYRAALKRDHPELRMIEYDNFIARYQGNEQYYTRDGVHLTNEGFHKYGTFIGNAASIRERTVLRPGPAQGLPEPRAGRQKALHDTERPHARPRSRLLQPRPLLPGRERPPASKRDGAHRRR
jgi:hypothetical protein